MPLHGWRLVALSASAAIVAVVAAACGRGPEAAVDWTDSVRFNGVGYEAPDPHFPGRALQESDLDAEFDRVRFRLSGNVNDPAYREKDGDAGYLDAGTPVYRVKGYSPEFRLAARQDGRITLFEAFDNPRARLGRDLLDVADKVRRIGVYEDRAEDSRLVEVGSIGDRGRVMELTELILNAPVAAGDRERNLGDRVRRYFISLHLRDGTAVTRAYYPESGDFGTRLVLAPEFGAAVERAIEGN